MMTMIQINLHPVLVRFPTQNVRQLTMRVHKPGPIASCNRPCHPLPFWGRPRSDPPQHAKGKVLPSNGPNGPPVLRQVYPPIHLLLALQSITREYIHLIVPMTMQDRRVPSQTQEATGRLPSTPSSTNPSMMKAWISTLPCYDWKCLYPLM